MLVLKSCIFIPSWTNRHKKHQKNSKLLGKKLRFKCSTQVFSDSQLLRPSVSNPTSHSQRPLFSEPGTGDNSGHCDKLLLCRKERSSLGFVMWGPPGIMGHVKGNQCLDVYSPHGNSWPYYQGIMLRHYFKGIVSKVCQEFLWGSWIWSFLSDSNKRCTQHQVIFFERICEWASPLTG